jgi:hypothetical protein
MTKRHTPLITHLGPSAIGTDLFNPCCAEALVCGRNLLMVGTRFAPSLMSSWVRVRTFQDIALFAVEGSVETGICVESTTGAVAAKVSTDPCTALANSFRCRLFNHCSSGLAQAFNLSRKFSIRKVNV